MKNKKQRKIPQLEFPEQKLSQNQEFPIDNIPKKAEEQIVTSQNYPIHHTETKIENPLPNYNNQVQVNQAILSPRDRLPQSNPSSSNQGFVSPEKGSHNSSEYQKKALQSPSFKVAKYVKITIQTEQNQNFTFGFLVDEKVLDIKKKLHKYTAVPVEDQILQYHGVALDDSMTIEEVGLGEGSVITMKRISTFKQSINFQAEKKEKTEFLQSTVMTPTVITPKQKPIMVTVEENTGMRSNYMVNEEETILELQKKWYKARTAGDDSNPIAITLNGLILDEDATLKEQGIRNGAHLKAILISRPVTPIGRRGLINDEIPDDQSELEFTPIEVPKHITQVTKSPLESLPKANLAQIETTAFHKTLPPVKVDSHYINFQSQAVTSPKHQIHSSTFGNTITQQSDIFKSQQITTTVVKTTEEVKTSPTRAIPSKYISQNQGIKITSDAQNKGGVTRRWSPRPVAKAYTEFGGGKFDDKQESVEDNPDDISTIGINLQPKKNSEALKIPQNRLKNASLSMVLVNGKSYEVRFDLDKTSYDLKCYVEQVVCISRNTMVLIYNGAELKNDQVLEEQGVSDGDQIKIFIGALN